MKKKGCVMHTYIHTHQQGRNATRAEHSLYKAKTPVAICGCLDTAHGVCYLTLHYYPVNPQISKIALVRPCYAACFSL